MKKNYLGFVYFHTLSINHNKAFERYYKDKMLDDSFHIFIKSYNQIRIYFFLIKNLNSYQN